MSARFLSSRIPELKTLNEEEVSKDLRVMEAFSNASVSYAQRYLIFRNQNLVKRGHYEPGDEGKTTGGSSSGNTAPATLMREEKIRLPVKIDPEEEKRLAILRKKIMGSEGEREIMESDYLALRTHSMYQTRRAKVIKERNGVAMAFLIELAKRRARVLALRRVKCQIAREILVMFESNPKQEDKRIKDDDEKMMDVDEKINDDNCEEKMKNGDVDEKMKDDDEKINDDDDEKIYDDDDEKINDDDEKTKNDEGTNDDEKMMDGMIEDDDGNEKIKDDDCGTKIEDNDGDEIEDNDGDEMEDNDGDEKIEDSDGDEKMNDGEEKIIGDVDDNNIKDDEKIQDGDDDNMNNANVLVNLCEKIEKELKSAEQACCEVEIPKENHKGKKKEDRSSKEKEKDEKNMTKARKRDKNSASSKDRKRTDNSPKSVVDTRSDVIQWDSHFPPRTPRDMPILLSQLSTAPDRSAATVYRHLDQKHSLLFIPSNLPLTEALKASEEKSLDELRMEAKKLMKEMEKERESIELKLPVTAKPSSRLLQIRN